MQRVWVQSLMEERRFHMPPGQKKKKKIICHKKENKTKQQQQQKGNSPLFVLSMKVKVIQSCLTLCDPMDCGLPGSPVHGIYQARILEWVAFPFSRGSSQSKDQTHISCIAGGFFTIWATKTPGTVSRDPLTVALQGVQVKTHAFRNMTLKNLHYHIQNT